jgi:DNA-nicking Smr family endonuclease
MMAKKTKGKKHSGARVRPLEGDDLFRTVMETTTPMDRVKRRRFVDEDPLLDGRAKIMSLGKPVPVSKPVATSLRKKTASSPTGPVPQEGFDRGILRQVKQGKIEIDGRLDLHGMTQAQAHLRLNRFIETAARTGKRCVLVITGKGAPADQQARGLLECGTRGVLRRMTPIWLSARNLAAYVVDYQSALPRDGGDGALYVRLRRQK